MELKRIPDPPIATDLVEAIRTFPVEREVVHCGQPFHVSPFDFYAECPACRTRIKIRGLSAVQETEDVFDAVFEWLNQPGAEEAMRWRQQEIQDDGDES